MKKIEKAKEEQDKIRLGLMAAPEPKSIIIYHDFFYRFAIFELSRFHPRLQCGYQT